jgi:hypothetical protein
VDRPLPEDREESSSSEEYTVFDNKVVKMRSEDSQVLLTRWEEPPKHQAVPDIARAASELLSRPATNQENLIKQIASESSEHRPLVKDRPGGPAKTKYQQFIEKQARKEQARGTNLYIILKIEKLTLKMMGKRTTTVSRNEDVQVEPLSASRLEKSQGLQSQSAGQSRLANQDSVGSMAFENNPDKRSTIHERHVPEFNQHFQVVFELNDMETNILLEDNYTDIKLDLNVHSVQIEEGTIGTDRLRKRRAERDPFPSHLHFEQPDLTNPSRDKCSQFDRLAITDNLFSKIMSSPLDLEQDDSDCSYRQMSPMGSERGRSHGLFHGTPDKKEAAEEREVDASSIGLHEKQNSKERS